MKKTIEIPAVTLNALKGLLFQNNGDIDLTPIIEDLSVGLDDAHKDLTAIHVALTMKGLKPNIEINPILYRGDWRTVKVFVYQGFSLIHGVATFEVFNIRWSEDKWVLNNNSCKEAMNLEQVEETLTKEIVKIKMSGMKEDENPDYEELTKIVEKIQTCKQ